MEARKPITLPSIGRDFQVGDFFNYHTDCVLQGKLLQHCDLFRILLQNFFETVLYIAMPLISFVSIIYR